MKARMKRKLIELFALLAAALLAFVSCGGTSEETTAEAAQSDTTPAPEDAILNVVENGKTQWKMIFPTDSDPERLSTVRFKSVFKAKTGADIQFSDDFIVGSADVSKNAEILIGDTNRPESAAFIETLPEEGYGYLVTENKVVIAGRNPSLTAAALSSFENTIFYDKEICDGQNLRLPVGKTAVYTKASYLTQKGILESGAKLCAWTDNNRLIGGRNGFSTAQGAATDGTNFYNVLHKKEGDVQKIMFVRTKIEGDMNENRKTALVSEVFELGHGNDLCYNPDDGYLVLANMEGKLLTLIDPETLTIIKTFEATTLPGVAYAIGYCPARQRYVIAAGGMINILDRDFKVERAMPIHEEPNYVGQGMDCDENFIFMPLSPNGKETRSNVISVYSWDQYLRTATLDTGSESETIMNFEGRYYINFNSGGPVVADLHFDVIYN